jgi:hypothetical protein
MWWFVVLEHWSPHNGESWYINLICTACVAQDSAAACCSQCEMTKGCNIWWVLPTSLTIWTMDFSCLQWYRFIYTYDHHSADRLIDYDSCRNDHVIYVPPAYLFTWACNYVPAPKLSKCWKDYKQWQFAFLLKGVVQWTWGLWTRARVQRMLA